MDICEGLSRVSWKLSCTVLRGGITGNGDSLLDKTIKAAACAAAAPVTSPARTATAAASLCFGVQKLDADQGSNLGSDALSMIVVDSLSADEPRLKEIEFGAPIHLAFNQLKLGDLSFHLTIGPG